MCETRWVDRHESVIRFKELYKAIYYALKKLEGCSNIKKSRTAFQLSNSINNSVFIIALHLIEKFFSLNLPLSIALQKVNIDLSYCYERVTDVCQIFKKIRKNADDEYKQIFFISKESILEGIIKVPRTVGLQTARNNIPADSPEQYYKRSIFLPFIDHFICQLQDRFINHHNLMTITYFKFS
jgi:hypothetical protein